MDLRLLCLLNVCLLMFCDRKRHKIREKVDFKPTLSTFAIHSQRNRNDCRNDFPLKSEDYCRLLPTVVETLTSLWKPALRTLVWTIIA